MTRIRIIGLALGVVFAVMVVASASALAAENPILVNSSGVAFNGTVTGESKAGFVPTLQTTATGAAQIECTASKGKGTVTTTKTGTGMTSGVGTVTFTGCKTAAGKCGNTATTGEITGTVSTLLVWVGKESAKKPGVLTSILPFTGANRGQNALLSFTCSSELVDVEGAFIAASSRALNEKFTTAIGVANATEGKQELTEYTENGKEGTNTLYSNQNHGAFSKAGESGEGLGTFSEEVEITEN